MQSETRPVDDERVFRALLANTQDAVFIVGLNFRVLRANERAALMLGYLPHELIDLPVSRFVPMTELNRQQQVLDRALMGHALPLFERTILRKDGSGYQCEVNLSLVRDEVDEPMYFLAIVRDVSERQARLQQLAESQRLFDGIASMLPGIIHILDITTNSTVYVNREMTELLGYSTDVPAGVGERLETTLIHPDDREQIGKDYARLPWLPIMRWSKANIAC